MSVLRSILVGGDISPSHGISRALPACDGETPPPHRHALRAGAVFQTAIRERSSPALKCRVTTNYAFQASYALQTVCLQVWCGAQAGRAAPLPRRRRDAPRHFHGAGGTHRATLIFPFMTFYDSLLLL